MDCVEEEEKGRAADDNHEERDVHVVHSEDFIDTVDVGLDMRVIMT